MEARIKEIEESFTRYPYSYFNVPDVRKKVYRASLHPEAQPSENWDLEKSTFKAARFILGNHTDLALPLIEKSLEVFPNNIQVWINKGMALIQLPNPDLGELEAIHSKFLELKTKKFAELETKIYYTYWIWDFPTSDDEGKTQRSIQAFREIIKECNDADEDLTELEMRSSSFCVKNIYRLLRCCSCENWILETNAIPAGFEMLNRMQASSRKYYQLHSWLWLSEFLQLRPNTRLLKSTLQNCKDELKNMPAFENADIEVCVQNALQIYRSEDPENLEGNFDANDFFGRLGKSYYFLALQIEEAGPRAETLEKAMSLAGEYVKFKQSDALFVPEQCVKILLNLWAVRYYQRYRNKSCQCYERDYGMPAKNPKQVWLYLAFRSWHRTPVRIKELAQILEEAKSHIKSEGLMWIQLPRIMYLLGEPDDKIKTELEKIIEFSYNFEILGSFAQFFEHTRQNQQAIKACKEALKIRDDYDDPEVIIRCLKRCSRN